MIINFDNFLNNKKYCDEYKCDIKYLNDKYLPGTILKKINEVKGEIVFYKVNEILNIKLDLNVSSEVESSYSLNIFNYNFIITDELYFSKFETKSESDVIVIKNNKINLDDYVYSLILCSVPINVHQEGESLIKNDEFSVYSEDEFNKLK